MGRREERDAIQSTWLVHEPRDLTGNRRTRRARVVEVRREVRRNRGLRAGVRVAYDGFLDSLGTVLGQARDGSWLVKWDDPASDITSNPARLLSIVTEVTSASEPVVESSEARRPPAPRDSAAGSEGSE
jgi:hypothetical protein